MSKTTTFTRKGPDGKTQTRIAHSPAEAVQLRFAGWKEATDEAKNKQAKTGPAGEEPKTTTPSK